MRGHRDQQEKRFVPRLLQYLQQTVRGLHSHLLRQPYHHRLVLGLERLKREFAYDFIRLAFGDEPLLIVEPNPPVPHLLVEIAPRRKHRLPPLGQKGIAHGFLRTAPGSIGREDEMHVRMNQFRHLDTRRTPTATVAVVPVRTVDILYIGQREGQRSPAAVARKELGMAYTPLPDTAAQHRLHLLLSYDIRKPHALLSLSAENGICAADTSAAYLPVEPKPPAPRTVSESVSDASHSTRSCRATTICAIRSPGFISKGVSERFTRMTLISPR